MKSLVQERRSKWMQENGPCRNCRSWDNLEVDHINRADKTRLAYNIWTRKKEDRDKELANCQVLCKPCHKKKSDKEQERQIVHGTISGYYRHSCRCKECKRAYSIYRRNRYKRKGV